MHWVIEYQSPARCWIREDQGSKTYGVTFQLKHAQRFICLEDSRHEMLRLGLSGDWEPKSYGGSR